MFRKMTDRTEKLSVESVVDRARNGHSSGHRFEVPSFNTAKGMNGPAAGPKVSKHPMKESGPCKECGRSK